MKLERTFRRVVFTQVLLGIVAYCIAVNRPGLLVLVLAVAALAWMLCERPSGRSLPRWMIVLGAAAAGVYLPLDAVNHIQNLVIPIANFTMWLQLLLLFARKNNREYAQVLMLSLLQLVSAAVISPSIVFGMLLGIYCVLSLFTVLIFELKWTADRVNKANEKAAGDGGQWRKVEPLVGRHFRRHFWMTAAGLGLACCVVASVVFVFTPRLPELEANRNRLGAWDTNQVGFTPQIRLTGGSINSNNTQVVAEVVVRMKGELIGGDGLHLRLRGSVMDQYDPQSLTWLRSEALQQRDWTIPVPDNGLLMREEQLDQTLYEADIMLVRQLGGQLFTLHPITHLTGTMNAVRFNPVDQELSQDRPRPMPLSYSVRAPVQPMVARDLVDEYVQHLLVPASHYTVIAQSGPRRSVRLDARIASDYARGWPVQTQRVRELALGVIEDAGLERPDDRVHFNGDLAICHALVRYLRDPDRFTYTLDNPRTADQDPVIDFLFTRHAGHCELFASGMAAMVRSLGMRARVISGFLATEYNDYSRRYVVRQSHAHAWVEVELGPGGWMAFDPTPPAAVARQHRAGQSWLASMADFYNYIELAWFRTVITYDQKSQENILQGMSEVVGRYSPDMTGMLQNTVASLRAHRLMGVLIYSVAGLIVLVVVLVAARWSWRHRRARAVDELVGPSNLSSEQKRELGRRIAFYRSMTELLDRHGYRRAAWQTPLAFAQSLVAVQPTRLEPVLSLTEQFYEVRFGQRPLDEPRRDLINTHLQALRERLEAPGGDTPTS